MEALWLLSFLSALFCSACGINTLSLQEKPYFEAIYQFGDSIADTGNDVYLTFPVCGRLPYGETFFHQPTGRCSDGLLMIDFIAQALQLPFLEPYLKKNGNFTHGANFAVAGSTALNVSALADKNITTNVSSTLLVQLDWFKSHLRTMCFTPSECNRKLRRALFFVGEIGGNDYNYATIQGKSMDDLRSMVPGVIQTIIYVVKELVDLGAKQIIVPGQFPDGCLTMCLAAFKTEDSTMYDELNCLRSWNEFSLFHNDQLQNAIKAFRMKYPDVAIIYADYYNALISILQRANSLGFEEEEMHKACCGSDLNGYNYDSQKMCGSPGVTVCSEPSKRLSWDGVHFTQRAYQLMANWLMKYILPTSVLVA